MSSCDVASATLDPCAQCETTNGQLWCCEKCECNSCDPCWPGQAAHRGSRGGSHVKTNPLLIARYKNILESTPDRAQQAQLHQDDEETKWFGIIKQSDGTVTFEDYKRYTTLMSEGSNENNDHTPRYPRLVSFIGQTAAGKGSLISMLIEREKAKLDQSKDCRFHTPVVGSVDENMPTSGDVHLYADPTTFWSNMPTLYADCEGLEGGETKPLAYTMTAASSSGREEPQGNRKLRRRAKHGKNQRSVSWADGKEKSKREYMVLELYPRLLYTFSDVVVFVLRIQRTFASAVLAKLINWAADSLEKSLNQPTLPHLVIALNATDLDIDPSGWDPQSATEKFFEDYSEAVFEDDSLLRRIADWNSKKDTKITSTRMLMDCYYSSIIVIKLPTKGRYTLLDKQIGKLREQIVLKTAISFEEKFHCSMLPDSDQLQYYLEAAFDHFAHGLNKPFNFIEVAHRRNPIPTNFAQNILKLATTLEIHSSGKAFRKQWSEHPVTNIFMSMARMVASCIMLDIIRQRRMGYPDELFTKYYAEHCENALVDFVREHWPCEFVHTSGRRCVNVGQAHEVKGHQDASGRIIGHDGIWECTFDPEALRKRWLRKVQYSLNELQNELQAKRDQVATSKDKTWVNDYSERTHTGVMIEFFGSVGGSTHYISYSSCFGCLRELPEHPLPCGHVICTACIESSGKQLGRGIYEITSCPLHPGQYQEACIISLKPLLAGVRVLCLDGGGMRGIAELEVLRAIEEQLPKDISIQHFFDLIVGTSTGGIIALGLGVRGWDVRTCIERFMTLCTQAFKPREFHDVPGLKTLARFSHEGSKYKTKPFKDILEKNFTTQPLFGGNGQTHHCGSKVAVTATSETWEAAMILTNYNRPLSVIHMPHAMYGFERADHHNQELMIWEAARATSAAPGYFKAHRSDRNGKSYIDGALYANNPVQIADYERKLIWPDAAENPPDILVSIGTTCNNKAELDQKVAMEMSSSSDVTPQSRQVLMKKSRLHYKSGTRLVLKSIKAFQNRLNDILDTERIWHGFIGTISTGRTDNSSRYVRINPSIGEKPPALDDVSQLEHLRGLVQDRLRRHGEEKRLVSDISQRLVASSFYFEMRGTKTSSPGEDLTCRGRILCRIDISSGSTSASRANRSLGDYFQERCIDRFVPYFYICEVGQSLSGVRVPLTPEKIGAMRNSANFDLGLIEFPISHEDAIVLISLCLKEQQRLPISGFPRQLCAKAETLAPDETRGPVDSVGPGQPAALPSRARTYLQRVSAKATHATNTVQAMKGVAGTPYVKAAARPQFQSMKTAGEAMSKLQQASYTCRLCHQTCAAYFYHCSICSDDTFDMCDVCFRKGLWCLDTTHELMKSTILDLPIKSMRKGNEADIARRQGRMLEYAGGNREDVDANSEDTLLPSPSRRVDVREERWVLTYEGL